MFPRIHPLVVTFLVFVTSSRIRGDLLTINLNANWIRSAVLMKISNGTETCFLVTDVFPDGVLVVKDYEDDTRTRSLSDSSSFPPSPSDSMIVIYNAKQDRICDWRIGHLVLDPSTDEGQEGGAQRTDESQSGIQIVTGIIISSTHRRLDNKQQHLREKSSTYSPNSAIINGDEMALSFWGIQADVRPEKLHLATSDKFEPSTFLLYHVSSGRASVTLRKHSSVFQEGGIVVSAFSRDSTSEASRHDKGESEYSTQTRQLTTPSKIANLFVGTEETDTSYKIGHGELEPRQSLNNSPAADAALGNEKNYIESGPLVADDSDSNPCWTIIDECCRDQDCSGESVCVERRCRVACDVLFDECCDHQDCDSSNNQICFGRNCVEDGFPRFSLSWYGDDDLDLFVVTPEGTLLSYQNQFDEGSGGRLEDHTDQKSLGFHIENVYFPLAGTASDGDYSYYVKPFLTVGDPDSWTLTVSDENGVHQTNSGTSFSPTFTYLRKKHVGTIEPPARSEINTRPVENIENAPLMSPVMSHEDSQPLPPMTAIVPSSYKSMSLQPSNPFQASRICLVPYDECCETKDCLFEDICVHRNCIDDGLMRITLQWVGDDDLDLFVVTPEGVEISFNSFFDPVSLGRFGEDSDQFDTGYHVENVYFSMDGAPHGIYTFFVRPLLTVDDFDEWTITVVEKGDVVMTELGYGVSKQFSYFRQPDSPSSLVPTLSPSTQSDPSGPIRPPLGGDATPSEPSTPSAQSPSNPPFQSQDPTLGQVGLPVEPPTQAPQNIDDCSIFTDECCTSSDCRTGRDVCEQRTCLRDGNPRITLLWTGDDDLDLLVRTPDGIEISSNKTFDSFSGGRYERDVDQSRLGFHVESVYFPTLGSPNGTYEYGIRSVIRRSGVDEWFVEIHEDGDLIETQGGMGNSVLFAYNRRNGMDGPQRPRPLPPRCSPVENECCLDLDCIGDGEICVQRTCIVDGSVRMSLMWVGDDDLDLYVETPDDVVISKTDDFDLLSGGRYEENSPQSIFDFHVDSVHFPLSGAPLGTYRFHVKSSETRGVGADVWTVRIFESGREVQKETGIGDSKRYSYERIFAPSLPVVPAPATPPNSIPSATILPFPSFPLSQAPTSSKPRTCPDRYECCSDLDCQDANHTCVQRTCMAVGSLRFDLIWIGDDDLKLAVTTPSQQTISFQNPVDQESGGLFEQDAYRPGVDFHAESVVFPFFDGSHGAYSFLVKTANTVGEEDRWTLKVYEFGSLMASKSGSGDSRTFTYEYNTGLLPSTSNTPILPPTSSPSMAISPGLTLPPVSETKSCRDDLNCESGIEVCLMEVCIEEGNPRFSLQWIGSDDLDLVVVTPTGTVLSVSSPFDPASGGRFVEPGGTKGFGKHVESVFFPLDGGPLGNYSYSVSSSLVEGSNDSWILSVSVNGTNTTQRRGSGSSDMFVFHFEGSDPDNRPNACIQSSECRAGEVCFQETCITQGASTLTPSLEHESCNLAVDECCSDSACLPGEACAFRTCVDDGSPRFTLSWQGDNDLDLMVLTPIGTVISYANVDDPVSGGKFGEEFDQFIFGHYVENVYFPNEGGPSGEYSYYVRSFIANGTDDTWTVKVYVDGEERSSVTGNGDSTRLSFVFNGLQMSAAPPPNQQSSPPTSQNRTCDNPDDECCTDSDCIGGVETCTQNTCIDIGVFRFTLTWTGDDDLDLIVVTPLDTTVSFVDPLDRKTGGVFGEDGVQYVFDAHVENIFFPSPGFPKGFYNYSVTSFEARGNGNDKWTVSVFINNALVESQSGKGESGIFSFLLDDVNLSARVSEVPCNPSLEECCSDSDCMFGLEACVQRTCITQGSPRFTLEYTGDDNLDLTVVTPFGTTLSASSPIDEISGGLFEASGVEGLFDRNIENVYFPFDGGPTGTYTYLVSTFDQTGSADTWRVSVFVGDVEITSVTGTGNANFLYEHLEVGTKTSPGSPISAVASVTADPIIGGTPLTEASVPGLSPSLPLVIRCQISDDECCQDSDCPSGQRCVQRSCIEEGNPRFTLTWIGADDYDLTVTPPLGGTISILYQSDMESGGRFSEEGVQVSNGLYVENIFFPVDGGPIGTYEADIQLVNSVSDIPVAWILQIYVNGRVVHTQMGVGNSDGPIQYDYQMGSNLPHFIGSGPSETDRNDEALWPCSVEEGDMCCVTSDCSPEDVTTSHPDTSPGIGTYTKVCASRYCISEGEVRFTLTWTGHDDLDLIVVTPDGGTISYTERTSQRRGNVGGIFSSSVSTSSSESTASKGTFESSSLMAHNNGRGGNRMLVHQHRQQVESISFPHPDDVPSGLYTYRVESFQQIGEIDDLWSVSVYVRGGHLAVSPQVGRGSSEDFIYKYKNREEDTTGWECERDDDCQTLIDSDGDVICVGNKCILFG